jgi:hypothetical protein
VKTLSTVRSLALAAASLLLLPGALSAQGGAADTSVRVTFGGFIDSYFAYDFGRPATFDRSFTTQPARHNEFNVNLAHVEAVVAGPRVRGRLALQAGTSVQSNYSAEPTNGSVSGPDLARHIQEGFAGYQVTPSLWVDAGIFFSHMGMESWVSALNPTYTRSLVADYSPYYSSGVRAIWQATPKLAARVDVVNGWQNISETNFDKGAGLRLDFAASPTMTLSYYNFFGNEIDTQLRIFNGIGASGSLGDRIRVLAQLDVGSQEDADPDADDHTWYGFTLIGRVQATPTVALVGRLERFDDEDEVLIATGGGLPGFRATGGSIGIDVAPHGRFLWRTEVRTFRGSDEIFPDRSEPGGVSKSNTVAVSSLAVSF